MTRKINLSEESIRDLIRAVIRINKAEAMGTATEEDLADRASIRELLGLDEDGQSNAS